jgi:hypothetical protein
MLVVYTALFGGYDKLAPAATTPGVRFVLFTDGPDVAGWECLRPHPTEVTSRRENRKYKIRSHLLFPHAEWTLYHDANLPLTTDPRDIVANCHGGLNLYRHPWRPCAYAEGKAVAWQVSDKSLKKQLQRYRREGFPENFGLYCGGFLVRNNEANDINNLWWDEYRAGCCRDQISLPYALWRTGGAPVHVLPSEVGVPFYEQPDRVCERRSHIRPKKHGGTL